MGRFAPFISIGALVSAVGCTSPDISAEVGTFSKAVTEVSGQYRRELAIGPGTVREGQVAALVGARDLFTAGPPPVAVIEFHPDAWGIAGTSRAELERLIADFRLRAVPLSGQHDPLAEYGHVALEAIGR